MTWQHKESRTQGIISHAIDLLFWNVPVAAPERTKFYFRTASKIISFTLGNFMYLQGLIRVVSFGFVYWLGANQATNYYQYLNQWCANAKIYGGIMMSAGCTSLLEQLAILQSSNIHHECPVFLASDTALAAINRHGLNNLLEESGKTLRHDCYWHMAFVHGQHSQL